MADPFDLVVVITLARRPERLAGFLERLPEDLPWRPEVFPAIDGLQDPRPRWWKTTRGAWGCYRSHHQVVRQARASGATSVMIFEDDATFLPGFAASAASFLEAVPAGPCQIYLGGQHLRAPVDVSPGLRRGTNVNRTHAYGIVGRAALELVDDWLADHPWTGKCHVDHRYGELHRSGRLPAWCPPAWLCGQAAGRSDVADRVVQERVWK